MTGRVFVVGSLIVAAIFISVACIYWPTTAYLLGFGRITDYSSHSALVVFVVLVLIWNLRAKLAVLPIRPFLFGFFGLIGLGFIWLAGQLVFTRVFTQLAVLAMVPMAVLTLLGFRWLAAMAFPFFVLMFAVPIWSPLVPTLVKWTAKFAELGIRASGVPIYREGAYFVLPSGTWAVADTCSGVAFLSTCLLLGVLYAWTIYRSTMKRVVFILGAAVIGVVGNWFRVYLTMMVAHLSDNRFLREDHYTFGWLLFAVFLFFFCWFGLRYRDAEPSAGDNSSLDLNGVATNSSPMRGSSAPRLIAVSVLIVFALAVWPLYESRLQVQTISSPMEVADISPQAGWSPVETSTLEWAPELSNPSLLRVQVFEKAGRRVSVFVGIFRNETWESKLVTVSNQLAGGDKSSWNLADRGIVQTEISGLPLEAKTGVILGRTGRVLAWHWYWINGVSTASDLNAKFQQLLTRLHGVHGGSAWVAIYTSANESSEVSSKLLQEFTRDMGGALENALFRTSKP